jgi:hypothetical protein
LVRQLHHGGYTEAVAVGEHGGRAVAVASVTFASSPLIDASDSESRVFAWDLETGDPLAVPLAPARDDDLVGAVAVGSVGGRAIVVGAAGGGLYVWDAPESHEGADAGEARPSRQIPCPGSIGSLVWGRVGDRPVLLAGGGDIRPGGLAWLRIWDPRDWRLIAEGGAGYGVLSGCAPTPDGRVILPWGRSVRVLRYVGPS